MRTILSKFLALSFLFTIACLAGAQPPAGVQKAEESKSGGASQEKSAAPGKTPAKSELEVALEQALKNNPDVRVAEAKVRVAEEELRKVQYTVSSKVAAFYGKREVNKIILDGLMKTLKGNQELWKAKGGVLSIDELKSWELAVMRMRATMAGEEAELPYYLLGPASMKEATKAPVSSNPTLANTKLEDWLEQAFRGNPEVRVAEAKLREAEESLGLTRRVVAAKVSMHFAGRAASLETQNEFFRQWKRDEELFSRKGEAAIASKDVAGSEQAYLRYKAEVAALDAQLPYLTGTAKMPSATAHLGGLGDVAIMGRLFENADVTLSTNTFSIPLRNLPTPGPIIDRVRDARDKRVAVDFKKAPAVTILKSVLDDLGVPYQLRAELKSEMELTSKEPLPLAAFLQLFQDSCPENVRFVVRDYGILITNSTKMPEGGMLLSDFWKTPKPNTGKN